MVCDPVTGLRRRPGAKFVKWESTSAPNLEYLYTETIDIAGHQAVLWIDTLNAKLDLRRQDNPGEVIASWDAPYVRGAAYSIRTAFVGDDLYVCNLQQRPAIDRAAVGRRWRSAGFAYVLAGAYGKEYTLTVRGRGGAGRVVRYTTPSGQGVNDAAQATPEYIMDQLAGLLRRDMTGLDDVGIERRGAYLIVWTGSSEFNVQVESDTGSTFMVVSGPGGRVSTTSQLPAILPPAGDGITIAVGHGRTPQYYRFDAVQGAWLETGGPNSVSAIRNAPVRVYRRDDGQWFIDWSAWEGRLAGDDVSNPDFQWLTRGITGMCAYQGRLCILSGNYVAFSASGNPKRWFRSTVTELLDSDPIELGASSQSSASYMWGVQYQRDLLLFSKNHQAVVPSTGQAITPRTATVVPTSSYATTTECAPQVLGKTLMYARPTSPGYSGFMEMIPSQYTNSQYISDDATPHLPRYFRGQVVNWQASPSIPMAVALLSDTRFHLQVYEYTWDGDQRAQAAWHTWTFPYAIESLFWVGGQLYLVFKHKNERAIGVIDPRGSSESARNTTPFLDLYNPVVLFKDGQASVPPSIDAFDSEFRTKWLGVVAEPTAPDWGMPVPLQGLPGYDDSRLTLQVLAGVPYTSSVTPPRPVVVDEKGDAVHTSPKSAVVLKYTFHLQRAYQINVSIMRGVPYGSPHLWQYRQVMANQWDAFTLQPGNTWAAPEAVTDMPAGIQMDEHFLKIESESVFELNLLGLSFVVSYKPIFQRR